MRAETNPDDRVGPKGRPPAAPTRGNLLVVEPEALLRWSLVTYLGRWFHVFPTDAAGTAERVLERHAFEAAVVCDDLGDRAADHIESLARSRNPEIRLIRIVTSLRAPRSQPETIACIEKPFELSKLAALVGVPDELLAAAPAFRGNDKRRA